MGKLLDAKFALDAQVSNTGPEDHHGLVLISPPNYVVGDHTALDKML